VQGLWQLLESPATDVKGLKRRTDLLIAFHLILTTAALAVVGLVIWRIQLLVTLTQRSNVETLVLAFIVVFLGYILVTTYRAAWGALRILFLRALGRDRAQRWLQRYAERDEKETKRSYLDVLVRGPRKGPIEIPLGDRFGEMGRVRIEGTEIALLDVPVEVPLSAFQLVAKSLEKVGTTEGTHDERQIVFWGSIDAEGAAAYASQTRAFDRLAEVVGGGERIWPRVTIDAEGIERLTRIVREATPILREALLMPDVEYEAEFSVPVVPEPFAFVQLRRRTQHADPAASIGCVTLAAVVMLALVAYVIVAPPWVPPSE
jgi:hypothetical protein